MASEAEPLRLFDGPSPDGPEQAERTYPEIDMALRRIKDAVKAIERADKDTAGAVRGARLSGCSWRSIAKASGLPHQTMHRRYGPGRR